MPTIRKPATKILQGKRTLFLTSFTIRDFMMKDFYRVDRLDVKDRTGIQRLLNKGNAKKFSQYIKGANNVNEAFLPTSIFLATSGSISYDENKKELFFDSEPHAGICPLDVVDGQHRIEGLKYAAEDNKQLLDFPIAAIIVADMSEIEKMLQFAVVNIKQQSVDKGVTQHIIARLTEKIEMEEIEEEELPYIPSWLKKQAYKGDDAKALSIAQAFNDDETSPWYGRIQLADKPKTVNHTITQATFVTSTKRTILAKNHPLHDIKESQRIGVMRNYWIAIDKIVVDKSNDLDNRKNSVVFKSLGLEFFHSISGPVINHLARNKKYSVDAMEACLRSAQDYLLGDAAGLLSPNFWVSGGYVSSQNQSGITQLSNTFREALAEANTNSEDFQT